MTVLYLFDIDGTLLHAHHAGRDALDAAFAAELGIVDASAGVRFGGKTDPAIIDEILVARVGRPAAPPERAAVLAGYLPRLRARLSARGVEVIDGVRDALAFLAGQPGVALGVATGNVREAAEAKLEAAALTPWFAVGGYGCDHRERAALVGAAIARGRARGPVAEVVVVGDTVHDVAAARACAATACAVATGADPAAALAGADVVFGSLAELPAWHAARFASAG